MKWYEYPPSASRQFYHYTSFDGLLGILRTRTLWATSIYYLNDEREFRYGHELIAHFVLSWVPIYPRYEKIQRKFLIDLKAMISDWDVPNIFVCSLSGEPDLLSQWRAYCPNGKGVAIGFTSESLTHSGRAQGFELLPCLYEPQQCEEGVAAVMRDSFNALTNERNALSDVVARASQRLLALAARVKHVAFAEEQEWRLISASLQAGDSRIKYRSNRSLLIPYLEVSLALSDGTARIGEVIVGPNPHMHLALRAVNAFTSSVESVSCTGIKASSAPYRAW